MKIYHLVFSQLQLYYEKIMYYISYFGYELSIFAVFYYKNHIFCWLIIYFYEIFVDTFKHKKDLCRFA